MQKDVSKDLKACRVLESCVCFCFVSLHGLCYGRCMLETNKQKKKDSQPARKTVLCSRGKLAASQQKVLAEQHGRKAVK